MNKTIPETRHLVEQDHAHVWHPFTAMKQWRRQPPLIIEAGWGDYLIDTEGNRYIDGVSSLWCNVHGHRVKQIDDAIRQQLDKIAHSTLLGLASPPSIELAAMLAKHAPGKLNKVFFSDAGATAVEVAFKMAVGYWHYRGKAQKNKFIGMAGAYHGDTTGAMAVGYSELFHRPYVPMLFPVKWFAGPDVCRPPRAVTRILEKKGYRLCPRCLGKGKCGWAVWPSECPTLTAAMAEYCLEQLEKLLQKQGDKTAAIVIEPQMQGAAGMICQPPGFVRCVSQLARKYDVLLIADEVAVGFGRSGEMFAVEHDLVEPDIMCLAKGLTGGYLPLAATIASDKIEQAFVGKVGDRRTFYHGHTYTGNALACAAAVASLKLFEANNLLAHISASAKIIHDKLQPLREPELCSRVLDVRQRGIMVGIELCKDRETSEPFDPGLRVGAAMCELLRERGLILRPLGDVLVLMPIPAMEHRTLEKMLDLVVEVILDWPLGQGGRDQGIKHQGTKGPRHQGTKGIRD